MPSSLNRCLNCSYSGWSFFVKIEVGQVKAEFAKQFECTPAALWTDALSFGANLGPAGFASHLNGDGDRPVHQRSAVGVLGWWPFA